MGIKVVISREKQNCIDKYFVEFYGSDDLKRNLKKYVDFVAGDGNIYECQHSLINNRRQEMIDKIININAKINESRARLSFLNYSEEGMNSYIKLLNQRDHISNELDNINNVYDNIESNAKQSYQNCNDKKYFENVSAILRDLGFVMTKMSLPTNALDGNEIIYEYNGNLNKMIAKLGDRVKEKLAVSQKQLNEFASNPAVVPYVDNKSQIKDLYDAKIKLLDEFVRRNTCNNEELIK